MMNKKGSSWWIWILVIVFILIMSSAIRHSMIRHSMYNDITGEAISDDYYEKEPPTSPSCKSGYINEYRCSGNNIQKKYQYSDCSFTWVHDWHCIYGCENAACLPEPEEGETCTSEWKCFDDNTKGYQSSNCSWSDIETCSYGCSNGVCKSAPCSAGWKCYDANTKGYQFSNCSWSNTEICNYGCSNSVCLSAPTNQTNITVNITCTDSDGGKDYYTKGYITYSDGTREYDECSSDYEYVWEYYCTPKGSDVLNYKCPYGCSDGRCKHRQIAPAENESSNLTVHFIDVGQGDSILIEKNDKFVLIDCGRSSTRVVSYLESQGISELEYLIASHPHADHIGGCDDVLENFNVLHVWDNGQPYGTPTYQYYITIVENTNHSIVYRGNKTKYFDMEVLSPPKELLSSYINANSIVIKLSFRKIDFLFTGDCESVCEQYILNTGVSLNSEILKVGHHGSSHSTSNSFLEAVDPEMAIISVGSNNQYRHPNQTVLDRLNSASAEIHRTDREGTIVITTDGETYSIETENSINT